MTGLINQDPQFIDIDNYNYNYLDISPCIDNGTPSLNDPDESRSDIGALYYNQNPENDCNAFIEGDINQDSDVNVLDVFSLVNYFFGGVLLNECTPTQGDINNDGIINILDIVQLVTIVLEST